MRGAGCVPLGCRRETFSTTFRLPVQGEAIDFSTVPPGPSSHTRMARDHLFISYATEDWALAEWLTLRLTAEGYRVWCDRFKLLGGESYPKDIDKAISEDTFRLLALLSHSSKTKDNPLKERTKALNVGKALGIPDFLIPLNVDGLAAAELDWMTSDLTFIPFHRGWARGLRQLLEKLKSINAPKQLQAGRTFAIESFLPRNILSASSEPVFGNCLVYSGIPATILRFAVDPPLVREERKPIAIEWPHYFVSPREVLAFQSPPSSVLQGRASVTDRIRWSDVVTISGIRADDIVSSLLSKAVRHRATVRGLHQDFERRPFYYFPPGLCKEDKVFFPVPDGGETWVSVTGERGFWRRGVSQRYRYHLGASFRVRRDVLPGYVLQVTPVFRITDPTGRPLPYRTIASIRKRLARDWWNHEWLNRHLAVVSFLAGGADPMILGGEDSDPLHLSARLVRLDAPFGINEAALEGAAPAPAGERQDVNDADDGEEDAVESDDVE